LQTESGLPARRAALELISAALARRGGLDEAMSRTVFSGLDPRARVFARALAMVTLRRLGQIDRLLDARLSRPPPEPVRQILRLATAQLFWMEAPDHAAVSTAVDLAASKRESRPFKGLVNGVLRSLLRDGKPADDPDALAPAWLFARWQAAYGETDARAIAAAIADEPATDVTPRDPADAHALAAELEGAVLPGGSVRSTLRGDLAAWPGYDEGRWWVQDASSAIPARLLRAKPGEIAVDLAAAPGGKSMQLAAAGAQVTALDRSAGRLERLQANLARVGLTAETVPVDAVGWQDDRTFDAVLLDAPCTSTGAFRRHPDALWTTRPSDVAGLSAAQVRLLDSAAGRVRPGGRLVYCVCSLEPEEGEAQIDAFLARRDDFRLDPIAADEGGAPAASATERGWLRILPHHLPGGTDGFFAARLVRLPA
jgi:16S rRNA (cytosine967-C5)-methyltransferase